MYETDLTDADWTLVEPILPYPSSPGAASEPFTRNSERNPLRSARRGHVAVSAQRHASGDYGLWVVQPVAQHGSFETMNHVLVVADRERAGREASSSAGALDSRSVKTPESGGPRSYDAGKKVKGRKRPVIVDMDGRGLVVEPQPANVQDRDAAPVVLGLSRRAILRVARRARLLMPSIPLQARTFDVFALVRGHGYVAHRAAPFRLQEANSAVSGAAAWPSERPHGQ